MTLYLTATNVHFSLKLDVSNFLSKLLGLCAMAVSVFAENDDEQETVKSLSDEWVEFRNGALPAKSADDR